MYMRTVRGGACGEGRSVWQGEKWVAKGGG